MSNQNEKKSKFSCMKLSLKITESPITIFSLDPHSTTSEKPNFQI